MYRVNQKLQQETKHPETRTLMAFQTTKSLAVYRAPTVGQRLNANECPALEFPVLFCLPNPLDPLGLESLLPVFTAVSAK